MPAPLTRIFSDVHFGDRASRVRHLAQLAPLLAGVDRLVLNGDTMDTRPGPAPDYTAECRAEVLAYFARHAPGTTFLTGNHDADFSSEHRLDLAGGRVFLSHGDVLFDDIVPWGIDAPLIARLIAAELAAVPPAERDELDRRLAVFRQVAARIPQRHQSERDALKYALHFFRDVLSPPRLLNVLRAWREAVPRAHDFVRRHRPQARFFLTGHTHRPGVWRMPSGITLVNTGSFCPPLGGLAVDLSPAHLTVRRIELRRGEFHPGPGIAEFPLDLR